MATKKAVKKPVKRVKNPHGISTQQELEGVRGALRLAHNEIGFVRAEAGKWRELANRQDEAITQGRKLIEKLQSRQLDIFLIGMMAGTLLVRIMLELKEKKHGHIRYNG